MVFFSRDIQCKDEGYGLLCYVTSFLYVDKKETELTDFGYSRKYKNVRISVKEGALEKEQVSRKIYMYSAILKK